MIGRIKQKYCLVELNVLRIREYIIKKTLHIVYKIQT